MKKITILLMILLSVTGLTFAEQIGPVLDAPVVQQDLFAGIDAPEMTDEEMAEVEGEGVIGAALGAGTGGAIGLVVGAGVSIFQKVFTGSTNLDRNLNICCGAGGCIGAIAGAVFSPI